MTQTIVKKYSARLTTQLLKGPFGPGVTEFHDTCEEFFSGGRHREVEPSNVTFVDPLGICLLAELSERDVRFEPCLPFPAANLESIANAPEPPAATMSPYSNTAAAAPKTNAMGWAEHADFLHRYAITRVRKYEVAEDLVQETLLVALRGQDRFGGRSTERTWLFGILKNKICDHFRKLGREINFTDLALFQNDNSEGDYWKYDSVSPEWRPEGELAMKREEFWLQLKLSLRKLPKRISQVFILKEIDDMPSKEICALLDISEGNLWVMLHRARKTLRQDLQISLFDGSGATRL